MRVKLLLFTVLLATNIEATTLSQLIESGLQHNSLMKKSSLNIEVMEAKKVKELMRQNDKTMITPCPTEAIAKGSEVLLAQLPVYGEVEVNEQ